MNRDEFASYFTATLLKLDTSFVSAYEDGEANDDFALFCDTLRGSLGGNKDYPFEFLNPYQYAPDTAENRIEFLDKLSKKDLARRENIKCYIHHNAELSEYVASVRTLAGKISSLAHLRKKACVLTTTRPPRSSLDALRVFANIFVLPTFPAGYKTAKSIAAGTNALKPNKANFELLLKDKRFCIDFIQLNKHFYEFKNLGFDYENKVVLAKFLNYFGWTQLTYANCDTVMMIPPTTIPNLTPFGLVAGFNIGAWTKDLVQQVQGIEVLAAHGLSFWVEQIAKEREKTVETYACKAAVAAIMARNMSHNIGSHALWHIIDAIKTDVSVFSGKRQEEFLSYIRERMGFIALMGTGKATWAIDYKLNDVVETFNTQYALHENIVRTEIDDLPCRKGEDPWDKWGFRVKCDDDRKAEIPHGLFGCHAFFNILENIIRNTYKHDLRAIKRLKKASGKNPEFTVTIKESVKNREYFEVTITDNLQASSKKRVEKLNLALKENLIDNLGNLNNHFLGMKEMRANASFLRMLAPGAANADITPAILTIGERKGGLAHTLYLGKPKELLLVCSTELFRAKSLGKFKSKLFQEGVLLLSEEALVGIFRENKSVKISHKLMVYENQLETKIQEFSPRLPFRRVAVDGGLIVKTISSPDELVLSSWEKWLKFLLAKDRNSQGLMLDWKAAKASPMPGDYLFSAQSNNIITHDRKMPKNSDEDGGYFDTFSSGDSRLATLLGTIRQQADKKLFLQLKESCLERVVVMDERIWKAGAREIKYCKSEDSKNIAIKDIWRSRQVYFWDHKEFIEGKGVNVAAALKKIRADILIVHQGVIDKHLAYLCEGKKGDIESAMDEFRQNWAELASCVRRIVIDSDRGEPEMLKEAQSFYLDFTDLNQILIEGAENNMGKHLLVNMIAALIKGE